MKARIVDKLTALGVACLFATASLAADNFRTADGELIQEGMTTAEVLDLLGPPGDDPKQGDVEIGFGGQSVKTWTYQLNSSLGGEYLVRIELEGGEVREINAEPLD